VSDTERIERIRKDPDEALNYIRDDEKGEDIGGRVVHIVDLEDDNAKLRAEVERLKGLTHAANLVARERDTAVRLLRELYVASRQVCEEAIDDYYRDTDPDAVLLRFDTALAAAEKHLEDTPDA
jgi:hypothetical protein